MHLKSKHWLAALFLGGTLVATAAAQPGHGYPPPGQVNRPGPGRPGGPGGRPDWRFQGNGRDQFYRHYQKDARRWRGRRRPQFSPGYVIPRTYRIQPVPQSYWAGQPPPPPGYQYGYYDGYVVAYNPTTRIIADVMDLVAGLTQ